MSCCPYKVSDDLFLMRWLSSFTFLSLMLVCPVFAQQAAESDAAWARRCTGLRTSYNPDADLPSDAFTLRPDDPRWSAFLAWAKEQHLFTSRLVGLSTGGRARPALIVRWATGTVWETQVTMPWGQALAHLIAERNWRDVDFPEFFAERGGVYGVNLAERLAMLDANTPAPWQVFFDAVISPENNVDDDDHQIKKRSSSTLPAATRLSARLSSIAPGGQSAEVVFGSGRVVTYSAQRLLLDFSRFLTDCRIYEFFHAYDQPVPASPQSPEPASVQHGQVIYAQECSGCHGIKGDGQGVFATRLIPRPRDFTRGLFRYRSTSTGQLPTDEDLQRSVTHGLTGSGMPAFQAFLSPSDIRDVVAYLKQFSPRFAQENPPRPLAISDPPAVSAERMARGVQLYQDSGCPSCHGDTGKGDGRSGQDLKTSEGDPITPRNLTDKWSFRGGSTPHAVFQRLVTGMDGSSMASYNDALTEDQMWNLVFYVLTLSPQERPQAGENTTH